MVGRHAVLARDDGEQVLLDLERGLAAGKPGPVRHPEYMRVDGERGRAEGDVHDHVRRLATDAGQRLERSAIARHLAAVLGDEPLGEQDHVLRLVAEETDRLDELPQALRAKRVHLLGRVGDAEEGARGLVDAGVGRLRREHHRDQQREGAGVLELALGIRVGACEATEDLGDRLAR